MTKPLRVLHVSDVHGALRHVKALRDVERDITVAAGDLATCGPLEETRQVLEELASHGPPVVWVPGNCDSPESVRLEVKGCFLAHRRLVEIEGLLIAGLGGSIYTPFSTPFEYSDEELGSMLEPVVAEAVARDRRRTLVVSHTPPHGSGLDRVRGGAYVGSHALRRILEEYKPPMLATGHIHEAHGAAVVGSTLAVNPGPLERGRYALLLIDPGAGAYTARLEKVRL